ncbi:MAG: hypothetical protein HRU38_21450 [Saccharospirillaceae bacterium]|nr:hypothetical protein [Pseudomonadales bacterium]NRB81196.1 hypothetical protein [Saccharospirillaceae bacterium]
MINITDLHHDYLLITKMKMPLTKKVRLLSELLTQYENCWRVIGITQKALQIFVDNDFNKIKNMGVNRSHLVDRINTYSFMFENVFRDADSWWHYYIQYDETILSTSSENRSDSTSEKIFFENTDSLFKNSEFTWSYNNKEKLFIKKLAETKGLKKTNDQP